MRMIRRLIEIMILEKKQTKICAMILLLNVAEGARILGMFPVPMKSHMVISSALMKGLAARGHRVVVFSPFPEKQPLANYTEVNFPLTYEQILPGSGDFDWFAPKRDWLSQIHPVNIYYKVGNGMCEKVFEHEYVQELIHTKHEHFDLLIIGTFYNECVLGLAHILNVPVVQICSFGGLKWMGNWVGNPELYSYIPDVYQDFSDRMMFSERLRNSLSEIYIKISRDLYFLPAQNAIMRRYINYTGYFPSIQELEQRIALVLVNSHFSISYPRPVMPNFVQVGGLHVQPPKKLPQDIEKFLDEAPDGVIYFSMGSNLQSSNLPEATRKALLEAFSKLKQKVLWKWETDSLPGQPSNVKLGKWLPQSDILAHQNVRLFITHGGLLSTQETVHRGVPVIGIPVYADQSLNMARIESAGLGIRLAFGNVSAESLTWAIHEILRDPKYQQNAQRLSRIFRDQPLTPLEQAVFWTEYVIRHKGAPHMRSAALDLSWFQYFLLDVIVVLAIAFVAILTFVFVMLMTLYRKLRDLIPRVSKDRKKQVKVYIHCHYIYHK